MTKVYRPESGRTILFSGSFYYSSLCSHCVSGHLLVSQLSGKFIIVIPTIKNTLLFLTLENRNQ